MPGPQPVPQYPLQECWDMPRGGPQWHSGLCLQLPPGLLWAPLPDTPGQRLPGQPLPQRGHL
jgi:hypothetical protein